MKPNSEKKYTILRALRKPQSSKQLANTTKINPTTVRAYLISMVRTGEIEEIATYPKTYRTLGELPEIKGPPKKLEVSKDNIEKIEEILNSNKDSNNEVIKITQNLLRNFTALGGDKDELVAAAKLYIELGYALNNIAKDK